jgi:hypothetical protein
MADITFSRNFIKWQKIISWNGDGNVMYNI